VTALVNETVKLECTPASDLEPFMQWFFTREPVEMVNGTPTGEMIQVDEKCGVVV